MKKSVYSLVLNDDIVSAIDQAAYEMGASRSGLINKILADYVSYTTPEQKMQNIFEEIGRMMRELDSFKILSHSSPSMPVSYTHLDVYKRQLKSNRKLTERHTNFFMEILQKSLVIF